MPRLALTAEELKQVDKATKEGAVARAMQRFSAADMTRAPSRSEIYGMLNIATEALLTRIAALESREPFPYQGVHEEGRQYQRGMFTTHRGGIWYARCTTRQRPGDGPDWQLSVKAGRDLRDAKPERSR